MSMIDEESLTAPATAAELTRRGLIKGMGFVAVVRRLGDLPFA